MNENIAKIEAKGFQDLCNHFRELEEKNKFLENENLQLKADNTVLGNELTYFKEKCADLEEEVNDLSSENFKRIEESNRLFGELEDIKHMSVWEFANKYCCDAQLEEAGHQLARELLGGR